MRSTELVGIPQPIVCCGKIGRIGGGGSVAQGRMWAALIVIIDLFGDLRAGVVEAEEQAR